jgi:CubicO group peptidase (beta-lactamase class C family)
VVKLTRDMPLEFAPGERFAYNNTGYVLLGHIIEKLTGNSYATHLGKTVFEPLGMKDSGYDSDEAIIPRRAAGYTGAGRNAKYIDMSQPHAAGALYSTVGDLLKWNAALHGGKLLSPDSYREMTTPGKGNYGYGLTINKAGERTILMHGGGIFGFSTMLTYVPEHQTTVAVLSNREGGAPGQIGIALTQLATGDDVKPRSPRVEISLAAEKKQRLTGDYELRPGFVLKIFMEGERLMTQATGQGAIEIFPMSESRFFPKVIDAELEFELEADGPPKSLTLRQGGAVLRAPRK